MDLSLNFEIVNDILTVLDKNIVHLYLMLFLNFAYLSICI